MKEPRLRVKTSDALDKIIPKTDFTVSPVEVHYESPELHSMTKRYNEIDDFPSDESSIISESSRSDQAAETILRWKIIIKHHQLNASGNEDQELKLPSLKPALQE